MPLTLENEFQKLSASLSQLKEENKALKKQLDAERLEKEKHLSATEAAVSMLDEEKARLQELLAEANEKRHQAELNEAVAKTRAESLEQQMKEKGWERGRRG